MMTVCAEHEGGLSGRMNVGMAGYQTEARHKIVYGHAALTPEEFAEKIDNEAGRAIDRVPVKAELLRCSKWYDSRHWWQRYCDS